MKNNKKLLTFIIPAVCLVLAIAIILVLLATCDGNNGGSPSSAPTLSTESDINELQDEPENSDTSDGIYTGSENEDEYTSSNGEDELGWEDAIMTESLEIHNSATPIMTNYRGMSGNVWHAFGFMKDDISGRVYTDDMMKLELKRQYDYGIRFCRTRFDSRWAWDDDIGWNWDSKRMNYFYDYCRALQENDTEILLNLGWHLHALYEQKANIDEVSYLTGLKSDITNPDPTWSGRYSSLPDRYGEATGYDLSQYDSYYKNMAIGALRYAEWGSQAILELKKRGINNVTHVMYFTETNYNHEWTRVPVEEYYFIAKLMKQKFTERGVAKMFKHVGPSQGSTEHQAEQLYNILVTEGDTELFDVYTDHVYPRTGSTVNDVYYDYANEWFTGFVQPLKDAGIFNNSAGKEFWIDEFYCGTSGVVMGGNDAWSGLQNVVCAIAGQQVGVQNIMLWQIFDQLWTDQTNTSNEFNNGIHIVGSAPSLLVSQIPRQQYYLTGLFSRYNGYQNGTVYETNSGYLYGVYVSCVKLEDGNYTVTVVNANYEPVNIEVNFDKAINKTLFRHKETVEVEPETEAKLAGPDKTYVNVKDKFRDTLPAGCVAVYTSVKG